MGAPFGAVASVHAWERVGAAIAHVARVLLKLPVLRYVDDYWSPERWVLYNLGGALLRILFQGGNGGACNVLFC